MAPSNRKPVSLRFMRELSKVLKDSSAFQDLQQKIAAREEAERVYKDASKQSEDAYCDWFLANQSRDEIEAKRARLENEANELVQKLKRFDELVVADGEDVAAADYAKRNGFTGKIRCAAHLDQFAKEELAEKANFLYKLELH